MFVEFYVSFHFPRSSSGPAHLPSLGREVEHVGGDPLTMAAVHVVTQDTAEGGGATDGSQLGGGKARVGILVPGGGEAGV